MRSLDLAEVLRLAMDSRLSDVWTSQVGEIVSWDPTKGRATVRVTVKSPVYAEDGVPDRFEQPADIPDVPVLFPWAPNSDPESSITWPINVGDPCLIFFTMRDPSLWRVRGQAAEPADLRTHGIAGAFAMPCSVGPDGVGPEGLQAPGAMVLTAADIRLGKHVATKQVVIAQDVNPDPTWFADLMTVLTAMDAQVIAAGGATSLASAAGVRLLAGTSQPALASRVKGY